MWGAFARSVKRRHQQLGAHGVQAGDRKAQRLGDVTAARAELPLRVAQVGQGQQAARGRLVTQRARGAMRTGRDAVAREGLREQEAQGIAEERREDGDLAGKDALLIYQPGDLARDPLNHLGIVAVIFESNGGSNAGFGRWRRTGGGQESRLSVEAAAPTGRQASAARQK